MTVEERLTKLEGEFNDFVDEITSLLRSHTHTMAGNTIWIKTPDGIAKKLKELRDTVIEARKKVDSQEGFPEKLLVKDELRTKLIKVK